MNRISKSDALEVYVTESGDYLFIVPDSCGKKHEKVSKKQNKNLIFFEKCDKINVKFSVINIGRNDRYETESYRKRK